MKDGDNSDASAYWEGFTEVKPSEEEVVVNLMPNTLYVGSHPTGSVGTFPPFLTKASVLMSQLGSDFSSVSAIMKSQKN